MTISPVSVIVACQGAPWDISIPHGRTIFINVAQVSEGKNTTISSFSSHWTVDSCNKRLGL